MAKKKKNDIRRDSKKESIFRELAGKLADLGVTVRREKLKQGAGWRVLSGPCQVSASNFLFVDSRLSQDEQIEMLSSRLGLTSHSAVAQLSGDTENSCDIASSAT